MDILNFKLLILRINTIITDITFSEKRCFDINHRDYVLLVINVIDVMSYVYKIPVNRIEEHLSNMIARLELETTEAKSKEDLLDVYIRANALKEIVIEMM